MPKAVPMLVIRRPGEVAAIPGRYRLWRPVDEVVVRHGEELPPCRFEGAVYVLVDRGLPKEDEP